MTEIKLKRGRPFSTNSKFAHVSRTQGSVYLVGMSNGMVKVGFSDNPRTRLASLNCSSLRRFGCFIVNFHVYDGIGSIVSIPATCQSASGRARAIESRCISLLSAIGRACAPTVEYFRGVDYFTAKALIDVEISDHINPIQPAIPA